MNEPAVVILWNNGTVTVFDVCDDQIAQLQGRIGDVAEAILEQTTSQTQFFFGDVAKGLVPSTKAAFKKILRK
jgi:hypothetical protein